jgi:hypothetical protein
MRQVSDELAAAITAPERTVRVRLSVDWDGDGHGGPGSLDDLSGSVSSATVAAVLQGTQPEQAAVVEGTAAATLDADLVKGSTDDERIHAVRYFSPVAAASPLAGKPRLGRDVQADVEFLTAVGWQPVPLLRGTSRSLPVRVAAQEATLTALDYRSRLRTTVQLPTMVADAVDDGVSFSVKPGMEATWVVSYVLFKCGFSVAPPPRLGCRLYMPMHGSAMPFISREFDGSPSGAFDAFDASGQRREIRFVPGPYLLACERGTTARIDVHADLAAGDRLIGADGRSSGRIELWLLADGPWPNQAVSVDVTNPDPIATFVDAGFIIGFAGAMSLFLGNGLAPPVLVTGPSVPLDGAWHLVGVHWNDAAGSVTFRIDETSTTVAFTPTTANAGSCGDADVALYVSEACVAEVQVTAGLAPTDVWQPTSYTSPAVVDRSPNKLDGIVDQTAREGWLILQELAAAEQGAVWLDADGRPHYATRGRLLSDAAQVPQRVVDADSDILELAYDYDLDKVVNVVIANYSPTVFARQATAWTLNETVFIPHGSTVTVEATLTGGLATRQRTLSGHANTTADGTGTDYTFQWGFINTFTTGPVVVSVTFPTPSSAVLRLTNTLGVGVWLVDATGAASLILTADTISQGTGADPAVIADTASRAVYGDQPLPLPTSPWTQRRAWAAGIAMAAIGDLATPQPVLTDLTIPGDPRLEPFDRFTARDPDNTELAIDLWYVGGRHRIDAGGYTHQIAARPARNRFLAGIGLVGVDLVG